MVDLLLVFFVLSAGFLNVETVEDLAFTSFHFRLFSDAVLCRVKRWTVGRKISGGTGKNGLLRPPNFASRPTSYLFG